MNRRELLIGTTLAAGLLAVPMSTLAQQLYQEGEHYFRLPKKVPTSSGAKIEVVEIFWYGCPHCFRFEPHVEAWLERKPENVEFVQIPGAGGRWTLGALAYYTAKNLGLVEETHKAMFDYVHVKHRKIDSLDAIAAFYANYGIDRARFDKTVNSFDVKVKVQRAMELMRHYQVTGVPTLIVNGQYKTNSLAVVDYLIRKESA